MRWGESKKEKEREKKDSKRDLENEGQSAE